MRRIELSTALALLLLGCGGRTTINAQICVEGRQIACACPGGAVSVQTCLPGGVWSPCPCAAVATGQGGDRQGGAWGATLAGSGAGGRGGAAGARTGGSIVPGSGGRGGSGGGAGNSAQTPDAASTSGTDIAQGTSPLIDVLVGDLGIYVVTTDAVALFDHGGSPKTRVAAPREITSAALDDKQLVIADRAKLTVYDPALTSILSADLLESCAASVLVSGNRFVCGPSNDWDRIFYTYDTTSGRLLASSNKYTYNGIPMRRVPGTDDFVTVTTDLSPSDFHLYTVLPSGEVRYINESPYHGDFTVTETYAFDGSPPTHLLNSSGLMLKIYDTNCNRDASSFSSTCFVKDGSLGTLSGSQYFAAMDSNAAGTVFGLVDPGTSYTSYTRCAQGCLLERVDVAERTILSQSVVRLTMSEVVAFRYDALANAVVVGYVAGTTSYYFPGDPYPGYHVSVIPF